MVDNAVLITTEHATAIAKLSHPGHKALRWNFVQNHRIHTGRKLKATPNTITLKKKKKKIISSCKSQVQA